MRYTEGKKSLFNIITQQNCKYLCMNDLASFAIHVVVYFKQRTRRQGQCTFRGKTHLSCYVFPALIFDDMEM